MPSPAKPDVVIEPIAAFRDNYIWLLIRDHRAAVVDPGTADPVRALLNARGLMLETILVTHHHADHTGGVAALAAETSAAVMGPAREDIATGGARLQRLREGDTVCVLGCNLNVIDVPGHTAGHIAFHAPELQAVFCGDTLFAGGCGRLFEGTPAQMLDSLTRLAKLPGATRVFCAHEYTLANLRFAREVEPDNPFLAQRQQACVRQREQALPTVPSTLDEERATNPFLRVDEPAVRAAADRRQPGAGRSAVDTFAALRTWKNAFA
ncbi:MAG: hydroxyacylglutathione hydrolase [Burkholderiaceae bacterium]|nr:hydroxyacylglutathione hydrolase [Burkholderiaceae bacterium]